MEGKHPISLWSCRCWSCDFVVPEMVGLFGFLFVLCLFYCVVFFSTETTLRFSIPDQTH